MINTIDIMENKELEEIKELIKNVEKEIKEEKTESKSRTKMKVIIPKETKRKNNPRITMDEEKRKFKKQCIICKEEKPIESFAVNYKYKGNNSVKFKNKCLECYKELSKEYYKNNRERLLEQLSTKYDSTKFKKYVVKLTFNSIEELEDEFKIAKEQFLKGELKEVYRIKRKKRSSGGDSGNNGGSSSPANKCI